MSLSDILSKYTGTATVLPHDVEQHFDRVASEARPEDLGKGFAAAMRSDATPDFGPTVGNLFGRSDPQQQAGVLNQLITALGAGGLAGAAGDVLGRILGQRPDAASPPVAVTAEQASRMSPADVSVIAAQAQQGDDSVIDKVGAFYAQHPTLVKSIGAAGLAILLGKMHRNN